MTVHHTATSFDVWLNIPKELEPGIRNILYHFNNSNNRIFPGCQIHVAQPDHHKCDKTFCFDIKHSAVAEQLKEAQLRRRLTQTQTGRAIGLSRNWLGKIELCELKRDVLRFSRLCKALELDPGRLIKQLETDST